MEGTSGVKCFSVVPDITAIRITSSGEGEWSLLERTLSATLFILNKDSTLHVRIILSTTLMTSQARHSS